MRLLALWLLLAISAGVTGYLLLQIYQQSASAQVVREEGAVTRACREIGDRYRFFAAGWTDRSNAGIDDALKRQLTAVVTAALSRAAGIEGGIWDASSGAIAYAFPTYEGSGPKTDVPPAETPAIRQVNAEALRGERPITWHQTSPSQVLIVHACPLGGPLPSLSAWTMTRVFTGQGPAYRQLLLGLSMLGLIVLGSALWLGYILVRWSRSLGRVQAALASRNQLGDLPELPLTGERELDRLVHAVNAAGTRVADERRRAATAERLAVIGRLAAGVAHEIRNPIAAMRLKAENALAGSDTARRASALQSILDQIGRLDALLRDLLALTQQKQLRPEKVDLAQFLAQVVEAHSELAKDKGVKMEVGAVPEFSGGFYFDVNQIRRALDNLVLNGIQNTPSGASVTIDAFAEAGILRVRVTNTGASIPDSIRDHLFDPFVTTRANGTGLGLATVREIARAHGGDVRLVPHTGGVAFELELPWPPS